MVYVCLNGRFGRVGCIVLRWENFLLETSRFASYEPSDVFVNKIHIFYHSSRVKSSQALPQSGLHSSQVASSPTKKLGAKGARNASPVAEGPLETLYAKKTKEHCVNTTALFTL